MEPIKLTIEQEFTLKAFENQVKQMSREQAQQFLINLHRQMIVREATYDKLLKHEWGV